MNAEAIVSVSAAVVALTQIIKWQGMRDQWAPIVVLFNALLGCALWAYSRGDFARATVFSYFAGWISVSLTAAGVFGFTRAAATAVTNTKPN